MSAIYESSGRAREYFELALNLYRGCDHHCRYCYAPAATKTERQVFDCPKPRKDIIAQVEKDARAAWARGEARHILMSFSCDPYQVLDEELGLTRDALLILKRYGLKVAILSKGGKRSERDLDLLDGTATGDWYGTTLTLMDGPELRKWEPDAAPTEERLLALRKAHAKGIRTWASLEPVIDPEQTLALIDASYGFVDQYKVGTLNYVANKTDWAAFARAIVKKMAELGASYYLKEDLRKWLQ